MQRGSIIVIWTFHHKLNYNSFRCKNHFCYLFFTFAICRLGGLPGDGVDDDDDDEGYNPIWYNYFKRTL